MVLDDRSYYQRRAENEIERSRRATQPVAVRAHHQLATAYLQRVAALDAGGNEGS